ncbi:hypothetical protein PSY73_23790, partial [Shigella flexneri]|nr:hypothetical protein [Shigella flexneri]
ALFESFFVFGFVISVVLTKPKTKKDSNKAHPHFHILCFRFCDFSCFNKTENKEYESADVLCLSLSFDDEKYLF